MSESACACGISLPVRGSRSSSLDPSSPMQRPAESRLPHPSVRLSSVFAAARLHRSTRHVGDFSSKSWPSRSSRHPLPRDGWTRGTAARALRPPFRLEQVRERADDGAGHGSISADGRRYAKACGIRKRRMRGARLLARRCSRGMSMKRPAPVNAVLAPSRPAALSASLEDDRSDTREGGTVMGGTIVCGVAESAEGRSAAEPRVRSAHGLDSGSCWFMWLTEYLEGRTRA
jgi:hypothetical protein